VAGVGAIVGIGTAPGAGATPTMTLGTTIPILTTTDTVPRSASHSAVAGTSIADVTSVVVGTSTEEAAAAGKALVEQGVGHAPVGAFRSRNYDRAAQSPLRQRMCATMGDGECIAPKPRRECH